MCDLLPEPAAVEFRDGLFPFFSSFYVGRIEKLLEGKREVPGLSIRKKASAVWRHLRLPQQLPYGPHISISPSSAFCYPFKKHHLLSQNHSYKNSATTAIPGSAVSTGCETLHLIGSSSAAARTWSVQRGCSEEHSDWSMAHLILIQIVHIWQGFIPNVLIYSPFRYFRWNYHETFIFHFATDTNPDFLHINCAVQRSLISSTLNKWSPLSILGANDINFQFNIKKGLQASLVSAFVMRKPISNHPILFFF